MNVESREQLNGDRTPRQPGPSEIPLEKIRKAVLGIRFGEVRVIIQDGLVVQIERIEKQRFR